jgi:hypothetical protein
MRARQVFEAWLDEEGLARRGTAENLEQFVFEDF